jgi:hypothetical protein
MRECQCRNWQNFDLNIIAHLLAKGVLKRKANFDKYSLKEAKIDLKRGLFWIS